MVITSSCGNLRSLKNFPAIILHHYCRKCIIDNVDGCTDTVTEKMHIFTVRGSLLVHWCCASFSRGFVVRRWSSLHSPNFDTNGVPFHPLQLGAFGSLKIIQRKVYENVELKSSGALNYLVQISTTHHSWKRRWSAPFQKLIWSVLVTMTLYICAIITIGSKRNMSICVNQHMLHQWICCLKVFHRFAICCNGSISDIQLHVDRSRCVRSEYLKDFSMTCSQWRKENGRLKKNEEIYENAYGSTFLIAVVAQKRKSCNYNTGWNWRGVHGFWFEAELVGIA